MNAHSAGDRTLTELDHVRLAALLRRGQSPTSAPLADLLDNADLVPSREVDADVVTMNSQVELVDAGSGERRKLVVCYPGDANAETGSVSALSPVGSALLGCRVGDVVSWRTPDGREQRAEIVALHFQPEASGDFAT
jgi:regulator of nucleoside diphosphate kinase